MKKNKKIYLKKIVAVLVLASVLSSLLLVTSSASNIIWEDNNNVHVVPFFNPVGVTAYRQYEDGVASYNFSYGGDFYAELPAQDISYGYRSKVAFLDQPSQTWFELERFNDIRGFAATADRPAYFTWGAQFYQSSVDTVLYSPYQSWQLEDFVYKRDYAYKTPYLDITMNSNYYVAENATYRYVFDITYYNPEYEDYFTDTYFGEYELAPIYLNTFRVHLVDHTFMSSVLELYDTRYAYISNYIVYWKHPSQDGSRDFDGRVSRMFVGGLIDDNGYYPDIDDYERYAVEQFKFNYTPPDNVDVSTWLVSGVKGFMDTPLFGNFSIGMIFLSIFGFWFLIMFLKKFAGG